MDKSTHSPDPWRVKEGHLDHAALEGRWTGHSEKLISSLGVNKEEPQTSRKESRLRRKYMGVWRVVLAWMTSMRPRLPTRVTK